MSRPQHPIFHGPVPVDLEIDETPTPPDYADWELVDEVPKTLPTVKILKKQWDPMHLPVGYRPDDSEPGLVTSGAGFLDSPDMEVITGGIHLKGPDYVAIGRQGHVLQWGFYGAPEEMTETGQHVFINAIHYIAGFKDAPILALRETPSRDSVAVTLALLNKYPPENRGAVLDRTFGGNVPDAARGDRAARREWFVANRPYLFYEGALRGGHYLVDEDARTLGIPNFDVALLARCIDDLKAGRDEERAQRLLERYTGLDLASAEQWQKWLAGVKGKLYFSDWYGYRFHTTDEAEAPPAPESAAGRTEDPVKLEVFAYGREGTIYGQLKVKIAPAYHIYAPNASEPAITVFAIRLPTGSSLAWLNDEAPQVPHPRGGHIFGHFTMPFKLEGESDTVRLLVDYQACTEEYCLPPVVGAELTARLAG